MIEMAAVSALMRLVAVVVINHVTITALASAIASWVKNQQAVRMVKDLTAQEAVVLMTAIKSAHKMARALHVVLVTVLHLVLNQLTIQNAQRATQTVLATNLRLNTRHATNLVK
jgi:uncharacterized membrane protein YidH (DUF202 family)